MSIQKILNRITAVASTVTAASWSSENLSKAKAAFKSSVLEITKVYAEDEDEDADETESVFLYLSPRKGEFSGLDISIQLEEDYISLYTKGTFAATVLRTLPLFRDTTWKKAEFHQKVAELTKLSAKDSKLITKNFKTPRSDTMIADYEVFAAAVAAGIKKFYKL